MPSNVLQIQSVGPLSLLSGQKVINVLITNTAQIGDVIDTNLLIGDNVIVCPTNCVSSVIVPPSTNTATIKLKGSLVDTGIKLSKTQPAVISLDPTQTSFIINLSAAVPGWEITFI